MQFLKRNILDSLLSDLVGCNGVCAGMLWADGASLMEHGADKNPVAYSR